MLREIVNFTKSLSPEIFFRNLKPSEGLHLVVWLSDNGDLEKCEYEVFKKKQEITTFLKTCLRREINSKCVSMNKALDSKKKIHSCSPFSLAFKLKTFTSGDAEKRFKDYLRIAKGYCITDEQNFIVENFINFCTKNLPELLQNILADIAKKSEEDKKYKITEAHYLRIYLGNVSLEEFKNVHMNYLRLKVFNKDEFNIKRNNKIYGVSDYLTGYNQKKPFLQHLTATFEVNNRVNEDDALWLYRFKQLKDNKQLPNPLPIFIDKQELNQEIVTIFLDQEGNISYSDIIRSVHEKYKDLGNYYLLNIQGKNIKDFDFVSSFKMYIEPKVRILPIFSYSSKLINRTIENVFDFEKEIVPCIFNNKLIQHTKNGIRYRYFEDIDYNPKYISTIEYQLVLKYRKAFYDYIYKSKREAINSRIFYEIMQSMILNDLKQDEFKDNRHTKDFAIKEKLNIWFSLYEFFDQPNRGEIVAMANLTVHLQERVKAIAEDENSHIENDNEFAFAAGQIIYYLFSQSETANKTHALLEPFLQKTDCEQFKMAISRTLDRYKHKIHFNHLKFNKIISEILGYYTDQNIKNLMPIILAGYFSDNVLYGKKEMKKMTEEIKS
ncbi:hypothetical protein Calab_1310 [Caldithrix abyssi DSM 13497]|uniref:CRISPR-associated protein Csh1 n=1 Tax=Caldithrix abyssi DSM 13497 TaxID=880073 RepID=H1XYR6_CALAY|nr:hypothetical protein [Caldithrix abyssi]APF20554.1 CRISPR-associated protein Csh1 [Caldithrix abyssi DSM 13497]EHO40935.1 hypothetical protein Calab_1310 [Caldithrix abyssi DSM 13497]